MHHLFALQPRQKPTATDKSAALYPTSCIILSRACAGLMECHLPLQLRQCPARILLLVSQQLCTPCPASCSHMFVLMECHLALQPRQWLGRRVLLLSQQLCTPCPGSRLTHACADQLSFGIAAKAVDNKATATCESAAQHIQSCITLRCDAGESYHASNHSDVMMLTDCCLLLQPRQ